MASAIAERDFAVVVGISQYPRFEGLVPLAGAAADAALFARWLLDEGVPESRIALLTTNPDEAAQPTHLDISRAFTAIQEAADRIEARRLYIYLTGYGYGLDGDEFALLTADASLENVRSSIGAKAYADYFRASGSFEEVILFVDCSRVEVHAQWIRPSLIPPVRRRNILPSYLYGFATAFGTLAFETPLPDSESGAHGVFTSALLLGLRGRAALPDGSITSQSLASYVSSRVHERQGPQQTPIFLIDAARPITFREPTPPPAQASQTAAGAPAAQSKVQPIASAIGTYPTPRIASDRWASSDALGYAAFARTVATLITHEDTAPPLTIGIKAPWGAGKTSLMKRIQYLLDGCAGITEENEAARRNRDLDVGMTLKQLLAGLRALTQPDAAGEPARWPPPFRRVVDRVRAFVGRAPTVAGTPPTTPGAVGSGVKDTRRDERYKYISQLLERVSAIVSRAARHLPSVQFTPPAPVQSDDGAAAGIEPRVTVWFNAWKYQTSEQIWAGLAHCIISQVTARMTPPSRELFWLRLHASRVDVNRIRWKARRLVLQEVMPLLVLCLVFLSGAIAALAVGLLPLGSVGMLAAASSVAGSWYKGSRKLGEKVSDEFRDLVREPDYEGKLGFLHLVESDIRDVLDIVATPKCPLVVFVDDLDRCAPHSVAEVVEAINLFLSGDYPNCIFVLGMEPAIVAAALEVANKELLDKVQEFGIVDSHVPLGWRFMEKIIQLPLSIPVPDGSGSEAYLQYLTGALSSSPPPPPPAVDRVAEVVQQFQGVANVDQVVQKTDDLLAAAPAEQRPAIVEASKRVYAKAFTDRDPAMSRFIEDTITLFQGNPRQLKRYVNLFRFMSTLRHSVSIDRAGRGVATVAMPTDEALAKFIALSVHWPQAADYFRLARQLDDGKSGAVDRQVLLSRLEAGARDLAGHDDPDDADVRWGEYLKVLGLERAGWARTRDFRTFLARGESLARYNECGLW